MSLQLTTSINIKTSDSPISDLEEELLDSYPFQYLHPDPHVQKKMVLRAMVLPAQFESSLRITRAGNWDWAQMAQKSLAHTQVGIYRRYFHSCRSRRYITLFGAVFLYSFGTGNTTDNIFLKKEYQR